MPVLFSFGWGTIFVPSEKCCWSTVLNPEGFNITNKIPSPVSRLGRAWHQPGFELSAAEKVAYCRKLGFSNDILLGSDNRRSDPPFKGKFLDMASRKAGWENVSKQVSSLASDRLLAQT